MPLSRLFAELESPDLAASVNVSSGRRTFVDGLSAQPAVGELFRTATEEDNADAILLRVLQIVNQRIDIRYENPHDTALSAYLLALHSTWPKLARIGAEAVRVTPNCWWARELADEVFQGRATSIEEGVAFTMTGEEKPASNSSDTGQLIIDANYASEFVRLFGGAPLVRGDLVLIAVNSGEGFGHAPPAYLFSAEGTETRAATL